jgi:hypothetical protein
VGLYALPQVVLPEMYGLTVKGSVRLGVETVPESSTAGYQQIFI